MGRERDSQSLEWPRPGLGQAECVDGSVTETSPEQRGSEVHTKKTVMIKTIETRDGEVSHLPASLSLVGALGYVCEVVSQVPSTSCAGSRPCLEGKGVLLHRSRGRTQGWGPILLLALVWTGLLSLPRLSARPHSNNTKCFKARDPSAPRDHPGPCPHCLLKPASFHPRAPHPATMLPSQPLTLAPPPPHMVPPQGTWPPLPRHRQPQPCESWMLEMCEPGS